MNRAASQWAAARQAKAVLAKRLPGSRRGTVRHHLVRAGHIAATIWRYWHIGPDQWQLKHLRWYLLEHTGQFSHGTRYRHWLTVRLLIMGLEHDGWIDQLDGPWVRPTGVRGPLRSGRPILEPTVLARRRDP